MLCTRTLRCCVVVTVLCCWGQILAGEQDESDLSLSDSVNSDFQDKNSWRAIDKLREQTAEDLTVPYDTDQTEIVLAQGDRYFDDQVPSKRRRTVRKRKRRPVIPDYEDEEPQRPQRRPHLQEQEHFVEEHWQGEALAEEELAYKRPYHKRRRQNPIYEEDEDPPPEVNRHTGEKIVVKQKAYRKPYTPSREDNSPNTPSLKELLKQNGGLSLVEILQQKNLSLTDLLKGKENAISVLKATSPVIPDGITERVDEEVTQKTIRIYEPRQTENESFIPKDKYDKTRRLPPARLPKVPVEESNEDLKEHMNAQRKRLSSLRSDKDNRIFGDVKHVDVVTEATTEKRIFVPSKYKTSTEEWSSSFTPTPVSSEENFIGTRTQSTTLQTTTVPPSTTVFVNPDLIIKGNGMAEKRNRLALKPRLRLPTLRPETQTEKRTTKTVTTTLKPETTTRTFKRTERTEIPTNAFTIDIRQLAGIQKYIKDPTTTRETKPTESGPLRISMNIKPDTTTENDRDNIITPDFGYTQQPNAKDEIMEILKDAERRSRLAQVLASRNMTFGELVALRERGSSQLHLADIFHNQSKEPNAADDDIIVAKPSFETFPEFPPALSIEPKRESRVNHNFENPVHTSIMDVLNQQKLLEESNWKYRNIDNGIDSTPSRLQIDEEEYMQLPSGVRSAIVASTAIVASSIVIFMTIFIVLKWHLKRRKQLKYDNSFNTIRGRLPILQQSLRQSQKRELSPVMVNVTQSSKNLLLNTSTNKLNISSSESECSEEQNSQYLWDSLRKSIR